MTLFAKDFSNFARDYAIIDESSIPQVVPAVFPVAVVDNNSEYCERTYPIFGGDGTMAATAAVFGLVGIRAGNRPIVVQSAGIVLEAASGVAATLDAGDLRTANSTTSSRFDGLGRAGGTAGGVGLATATILQGTTTLATHFGWDVFNLATTRNNLLPNPLDLVLRPGEGLWFVNDTVNIALTAHFRWKEWTFPLSRNPVVIPRS